MSSFSLIHTNNTARAGILKTRRGNIETPVFMPVATRGAIKAGVGFDDLSQTNAQICLGNTYHLHLRPGSDRIEKLGGLHQFMGWDKPILTDSGGFQVFSIKNKKITEDGVFFHSHIDGTRFYIDSETSIRIQKELGSDIVMAFDECPPNIPNFRKIKKAVEKTTAWAKRSIDAFAQYYPLEKDPAQRAQIFGIIQGGCFPDLRKKSLDEITALPFDGFALGGLAVGESNEAMYEVLDEMVHLMPENKARYLMGVGTPENLVHAVGRGIDMFDCVMPARNARHGTIFTSAGLMKIANAVYKEDAQVIDPQCSCVVCAEKKCSRAYLHHLFKVGEVLGQRYLTIHNLHYYQSLMSRMRKAILENRFHQFATDFFSTECGKEKKI